MKNPDEDDDGFLKPDGVTREYETPVRGNETVNTIGVLVGIFAVLAVLIYFYENRGLYIPSLVQKTEVGDIYENQLTRERYMVLEAHLGLFYIDSLKKALKDYPNEMKEKIAQLKPNDTYFRWYNKNDESYLLFNSLMDYDDISPKLYKKIN